MKTSEEIRQISNEIEAELKANNMPGENKEIVGRLRFISSPLGALDTYASGKADELIDKAKVFYSARQHEKYPGGPSLLRAEMSNLVRRLRNIAEMRERNSD